MIAAARWMVLLAAVHRWSGPAIIAVVLVAAAAEKARGRLKGALI